MMSMSLGEALTPANDFVVHQLAFAKQAFISSPVGEFVGLLTTTADKYAIKIAPLENLADTVAANAGVETAVAKYIIALLLAYPMAALMRPLPSVYLRHAWAAVGGIFLLQFVFGSAWVYTLLTSTLCYSVLALTMRVRALDGWRHWLSAITAGLVLVARHLMRSAVSESNIDDSVVQMVLTVKLYTLAYNLYDGVTGASKLAADLASPKTNPKWREILVDRASRSAHSLPDPLQFLGYVFNFTTVMAGPAFEIGTYLRSQERPSLPAAAPSRPLPALLNLARGLLFIGCAATLQRTFSIRGIHDQAMSAEQHALWWRLVYAHIALMLIRVQYYGVWWVCEGAAVVAGFGLTETTAADGTTQYSWSDASNTNFLGVEASNVSNEIVGNWNTNVQSWLKRYIFLRAPRSVNKWLTFTASAFWHGFYPGYYLTFLTIPLQQEASRAVYGVLRPRVAALTGWKEGRVPGSHALYWPYQVLKWTIVWMALDYAMVAFCLFRLDHAFDVWRSFGYVGHLLPAALMVVAMVAPRPRKEAQEKQAEQDSSSAASGSTSSRGKKKDQ